MICADVIDLIYWCYLR